MRYSTWRWIAILINSATITTGCSNRGKSMDGAIERSENEGDITISLWTLSNEWIKPAIDDFSKNLARKHWSFLTLTYRRIILDLNIPKIDGIDVLKHIRQMDENIRVLILSARSGIDDVVVGLDHGANDYVTKPFDFQVLEARIRSLLRRSFSQKNTVTHQLT